MMKILQVKCREKYPQVDIKFDFPTESVSDRKSGGCYIATCVYGSYDCPEVWTLRRFRDDVLLHSLLGRCFVKIYYKFSPSIVKYFGKTVVFKKFFKCLLDKMVDRLGMKGFSGSKYSDK